MNVIKLSEWGSVLTGREFGTDVMESLRKHLKTPVVLDFEGVETLGSSFGDEVVPKLAAQQGDRISVRNANDDIKVTLKDIAFDASITLDMDE